MGEEAKKAIKITQFKRFSGFSVVSFWHYVHSIREKSMVEAKVILLNNMQFTGTATSGHTLIMDADDESGGHNTGFRPMELLLVGFGGCSGMDVISILRKKRQPVAGLEINVKGEKMKIWLFIGIFGMVLVTGACTPMFMVGKGEGRVVFLGSNSQATYEVLCTSGDLEKVLEATNLSKEMKDSFYQYNCSTERSSDKVKQLFASMTSEQRKDIRNAFIQNGYSINAGSCCGDKQPTSGRM
jgi:flagellar basal body-associated protein FliL